jgi:hypothetical protein
MAPKNIDGINADEIMKMMAQAGGTTNPMGGSAMSRPSAASGLDGLDQTGQEMSGLEQPAGKEIPEQPEWQPGQPEQAAGMMNEVLANIQKILQSGGEITIEQKVVLLLVNTQLLQYTSQEHEKRIDLLEELILDPSMNVEGPDEPPADPNAAAAAQTPPPPAGAGGK